MRVALDQNGNRVYADSPERLMNCICQDCSREVVHKIGVHRKSHFAHKSGMVCKWADDKDNKSEWHIHMQDFFKRDNQEVRFIDETTGEVHIADIYDPKTNSVIEIQCSPIRHEEFISRTEFHITHGRRIVWIFDESRGKEEYGRFRKNDELRGYLRHECYEWMRFPRKCIHLVQYNIEKDWDKFSICVFTGKEEDVINRVYSKEEWSNTTEFSIHKIKMCNDMDINEFFESEVDCWAEIEPWKTFKEQYLAREKEREEKKQREIYESFSKLQRQYEYKRFGTYGYR